MRYFLDTEFIEDGETIDLISIALVCEDGRSIYCCSTEAKLHRASEWVRDNVFPHLPPLGSREWMSRAGICASIERLIGEDPEPIFYAYFADYDWVVFCQLFGRMIDLPARYPKYCRDLKQIMDEHRLKKVEVPSQVSGVHNALADAQWNRDLYVWLKEHYEIEG